MTGNQEAFQKAMNKGNSAAWDQDWAAAATFFRQALAEIPDHPLALTNLALALLEQQDLVEALKCYQRAAAVSPNDPMPQEKIAFIQERQGLIKEAVQACMVAAELHLKGRNVDKAVENFLHAISLDPEQLTARTRLAMIYDKLGKRLEAVSEYLSIASLLQLRGEITRAMQVVQYCLQIFPNHPEATNSLGLLRTNQKLPAPTRPKGGTGPIRMQKVRQLAGDQPATAFAEGQDPIIEARINALKQMAGLLFEGGDEPPSTGQVVRRGINTLSRGTGGVSLENAERTRILLHLGTAIDSQTQGLEPQAMEDLERAVDLGLNHPAVFFDLGFLLEKRDPTKALKYLQQSVRHPDYALASNLIIAQLHQAAGQLPEAGMAYLQALRLADIQTVDPSQADELNQMYEPVFESQLHQADPFALQKLCENLANQLVRPDWRLYLKNARSQIAADQAGGAPTPLAEMLLESRSNQVVEALRRVGQLAAVNKNRAALEEALYALEFAPTYMPLHVQIGELLLKEDHVQEAVDKFMMVATLYGLRGETGQAIRLLGRVAKMAPMDLSVRMRLIDLLTAQGRTDEAIQQYLDLAEIYYSLTELEMARQTYMAALNLAQQSAKNRSWAVQILAKIADIDVQRMDWKQALRVLEQLRTLAPEDTAPRLQLIDLNLRMGEIKTAIAEADTFLALMEGNNQRAKAIQFLLDLLNDHPERLEMRKRLAELYMRSGDLDHAVEQMDHLADGLLSAGRDTEAIAMVEAIIALNPHNVNEYRSLLQQLRSKR